MINKATVKFRDSVKAPLVFSFTDKISLDVERDEEWAVIQLDDEDGGYVSHAFPMEVIQAVTIEDDGE